VGRHTVRFRCSRAVDNLPLKKFQEHKPEEYDKNVPVHLGRPGTFEYRLALSTTGFFQSTPDLRYLG
jgi:hypothetical protein